SDTGVGFKVWDLRAREELDLDASRTDTGGLAFAPDRPLLAFSRQTRTGGEVVFWNARSRAQVKCFDWGLGPVGAVAFSLDGCRCATASPTKVVLWDVDV